MTYKTFGENKALKEFKAKYRLGDRVELISEQHEEIIIDKCYDYELHEYEQNFDKNEWIVMSARPIFINREITVKYGLININSEYYSDPDNEIEIMEGNIEGLVESDLLRRS